jgi:hypothetical protein
LARFNAAFGADIPAEVISTSEWTAGHALVAEKFVDRRVLLAGDAAHLFTPTGGMGYNTGIDDVANLGWKLAAVHHRWGSTELLQSYEIERRPIAERNTRFAGVVAESIGHHEVPFDIDAPDAAGHALRKELGRVLEDHASMEFDIPGLQLGMRYERSPIVVADDSAEPPDDPNVYTPTARPGSRLPHLWMTDGQSIYDVLGGGFSLLRVGSQCPSTSVIETEAARARVPLSVINVEGDEGRDIYESDLVLVRPDQHVAWRGSAVPSDPGRLLDRVLGATDMAQKPAR